MSFNTNNNPVYRGVRPIKPEEITEPDISIKAPSVAAEIPGAPTDSHEHRSGLIAQMSSDSKGSIHHGGFFEPKPTQFTNTKR